MNSSFVEYKTLSSFDESLSLFGRELKKILNTELQVSISSEIESNYSSLPLDRKKKKKHGLIRRTTLNRHRFRGTRLFQSSNEFHCRIQNGFYVGVESIERTGPYRMKLGAPRSLNCRQSRCRKCREKFHPFVHCFFDIDNWNVYY